MGTFDRKWFLVRHFINTVEVELAKIKKVLGVDGENEAVNIESAIVRETTTLVLSGKITDIREWFDKLAYKTAETLRQEQKMPMDQLAKMCGSPTAEAFRQWRYRMRHHND